MERLPAPAHVREVEARMADVSFVMCNPNRCVIAKELYWGRGARPRLEDQLPLDVFARLARDAKLVLDIGAYTGIFSLLAARVSRDAQVHAFEMVPEVAKTAIDNVVANDLLERVFVHVEGVGKDGDTARIPSGRGGSALPDFYSTELHFERGVSVPIRSIDVVVYEEFPEHLRDVPTVIKIDVEGTEDVVLENAQGLLAANQPDILCEVIPGANLDAIYAALEPHGYRYFQFGEHELTRHAELDPSVRYRDWLFTTKSDDMLAALGVPIRPA
ncbi:FkbM family methyltransferase [Phytoactinopolyspora halophila]|uniref:FkbM family methyltransferase n=1 Tax=Phytoactinopolyspora halophila TaxID=1981511 RepID=UPI001B8AFC82|nr:FkbM family methyltransferase [Phytoactinopolyspora halophila]